MRRVGAFSLASCVVLWLLTGVALAQGQFEYSFAESPAQPAPDLGLTQNAFDPNALDCVENDGPTWPAGSLLDQVGPEGEITQGTYFCRVEQLDPGSTTGAQGWQMGFAVAGCNAVILAATATQTDIAPGAIGDCELGPGGSGGFDVTELTTGAGNEGVVHSIVLHLKKGTSLDPTGSNTKPATGSEQNPATVCRFLLESQNPDTDGATCDLELEFVDGLSGSGQPLENKVTQSGQSVVPMFVNEVIRKTTPELPRGQFEFGFVKSPMQPAPDLGPTQSDADPNALDCVQNDGPAWPAGLLVDQTGLPGATTQGTYFCTLEQLDPGITTGAQGWQMGFSVTGCNGVILAATSTQTDIAPGSIESCERGPRGTGGSDTTELTTGAGNEGAVHSVVLHLKKATTLDPTGSNTSPATGPEENPATVCRFLLESQNPETDGDTCDLMLGYVDGLSGSGLPIDNSVTQNGRSVVPTFVSEVFRKTAAAELPGATFKFSESVREVTFCEQIELKVQFSNICRASGFSFGISHDDSVLRAVDAIPSGVTSLLRDNQGPEFWSLDVAPVVTDCSATGGVVVSMVATSGNPFLVYIPIGEDQEIATITYELAPGVSPDSETSLEFVDCLRAGQGAEPTLTTVTCGVDVRETLKESGTVRVVGGGCFQRGDCNSDGQFDISDPITSLAHVFNEGQLSMPITCLDACDANDDGELDISDAIRKLARLFSDSPPLPDPFMACGMDGTADTLSCESLPPCET
jgi:hypothetical protein